MKDERSKRKITIRLFEDDLDMLKQAYPHTGYNQVVRALVTRHVRRLRNVTAEKLEDTLSLDELKVV
jgi:hypothetical protein